MDFNKEYQKKIKSMLLNGDYNEMKINKKVQGGGVCRSSESGMRPSGKSECESGMSSCGRLNAKPMVNFDECRQPTERQRAQEFSHIKTSFVPNVSKSQGRKHHKAIYDTDTSDEEEEEEEEAGGSFMKSFKKVGKRVGKDVLDDYVDKAKTAFRPDEEGEGFTKTMKKFGQTKIGKTLGRAGEKVIVKGIEIGAQKGCEAMANYAAGSVKKRQVSDKMMRRGALLKQLMQRKGMSFGEASSYIKQNNLKY